MQDNAGKASSEVKPQSDGVLSTASVVTLSGATFQAKRRISLSTGLARKPK